MKPFASFLFWIIGMIIYPIVASAGEDEGFIARYIAAEHAQPEEAVLLWKSLIDQSDSSDDISLPTGITKSKMYRHYISALLDTFVPDSSLYYAKNIARRIEDSISHIEPYYRMWALNLLARKQKQHNEVSIQQAALGTIEHAYNVLEHIADKNIKSYALHGLIDTITSRDDNGQLYFKDKAATYVSGWVDELTTGWHRADALQRMAAITSPSRRGEFAVSAIKKTLMMTEHAVREKALEEIFLQAISVNNFSLARRAAFYMDDGKNAAKSLGELAVLYKQKGYTRQAEELWERAQNAAKKEQKAERQKLANDEIYRLTQKWEKTHYIKNSLPDNIAQQEIITLALQAANAHDAIKALTFSTAIQSNKIRARTLREVAETLAQKKDYYAVLSDNIISKETKADDSKISSVLDGKTLTSPDGRVQLNASSFPESYSIYSYPSLNYIHSILAQDVQTVRSSLPLPDSNASITRLPYHFGEYLSAKFDVEISHTQSHAGEAVPYYLYLSGGIVDLPQLYDLIQDTYYAKDLVIKEGNYILQRPLVIGPGAGLMVDGNHGDLRLLVEGAASIINAGSLYIVDATIIGWDGNNNALAYATYDDRYRFRPFIASWGGSHTEIAGSSLSALGYNSFKAYGLTLSSGPESLDDTGERLARPTGRIIDNSFYNIYYGFYSYEADDIALIGNEYVDNIVYGIDPHDRSRRLIIAYNTAYGTHEKHGIIISREVNDSYYIGNISVGNKGSGFMIDRESIGTFIYANTALLNHGDGLTLFESSCNFIAANQFDANKSMGIRIRNSRDNGLFFNMLRNNDDSGLHAYSEYLQDSDEHQHRNFIKDPYSQVTDFIAAKNTIAKNHTGISILDITGFMLRANQFLYQSPRLVRGDWFALFPYLLSQYDQQDKGIALYSQCSRDIKPRHHCRFIENEWLKHSAFNVSGYASNQCAKESVQ